jgi:hypothetical protein
MPIDRNRLRGLQQSRSRGRPRARSQASCPAVAEVALKARIAYDASRGGKARERTMIIEGLVALTLHGEILEFKRSPICHVKLVTVDLGPPEFCGHRIPPHTMESHGGGSLNSSSGSAIVSSSS